MVGVVVDMEEDTKGNAFSFVSFRFFVQKQHSDMINKTDKKNMDLNGSMVCREEGVRASGPKVKICLLAHRAQSAISPQKVHKKNEVPTCKKSAICLAKSES